MRLWALIIALVISLMAIVLSPLLIRLAKAQYSVIVDCATPDECRDKLIAAGSIKPHTPELPAPELPPITSATDLMGDTYADMRREFLNLQANYVMELRPGEGAISDAELDYGMVPFWGRPHRHYVRGDANICRNSIGIDSYCLTITESSTGDNCPDGCDGWRVPGYATWWLGAGNNSNAVGPMLDMADGRVHGADLRNGPANRLCVEFELDPGRVRGAPSDNRGWVVLAHPERAAPTLRGVAAGFGTYTAPFVGEDKVEDEERGGTFQPGGTHFYDHSFPYGNRPHHRLYPVTDRVFMACLNDAPMYVRSGMGGPYASNPLATVVGNQEDGTTDAYSYVPYITRIYASTLLREVLHPYPIKISRWVWAYEPDDVEILSGRGALLSVAMTPSGQAHVFPFTLVNWAPEARTYDITLAMAGPRTRSYFKWRVWQDTNANGQIDSGDVELLGEGQITIPADTDIPLLGRLEPSWAHQRYGRNFIQAHIRLQELDRLRGAHHSVRLWECAGDECDRQDEILPTLVYPSDASDYKVHAAWNQDKPDNPRLERNTPDYRIALERYRNAP